MPHSLHGKTGLEVVPMTREALDGFLPLRDAIPAAWTEEPVKVSLRAGIKVTMRDETFNLKEGMNIVPEYLAIFLACRGVASVAT
jgi:DNA primase small subunit